MGKISKLISELCPDGVRFAPLWAVTIWDKKFNDVPRTKQPKIISYPHLRADELFALKRESGDVFLLSTGKKTGWTTTELAGGNLCTGEVVAIPSRGWTGKAQDFVKYYNGKFVTADIRIATSNNIDVLLTKYLFYCMESQEMVINSFYRGTWIKTPMMSRILDIRIPLPPLPVQKETVKMLDKLLVPRADLLAEAPLRQKQFEYYTDKLMTFSAKSQRSF